MYTIATNALCIEQEKVKLNLFMNAEACREEGGNKKNASGQGEEAREWNERSQRAQEVTAGGGERRTAITGSNPSEDVAPWGTT